MVVICPTLKAWLTRYKGQDEFYRPSFDLELRQVRKSIGYGEPTEGSPDLRPWVPDILRHTAISHYFRATGSYGRTAEQFGNSESIIKKHYQSRVSSTDTKQFYALRPVTAKTADLGFPAGPGDRLSTYGPAGYTAYVFDEAELRWTPSEPVIHQGQAFFCQKKAPGVWVRKAVAVP